MGKERLVSDLSRREFVLQGGLYGGALWALLNMPRPHALAAAQGSTRPEVLTEAQWKTVAAITARIIPTDEEPGALEAGCVNFIDKALAHEDAKLKPVYEKGLAGLDGVSKSKHEKPFIDLTPEQQDAILTAIESGRVDGWPSGAVGAAEFFATVRMHTIVGFLAEPTYGGNRDYAGWKVAGYPGGGHHLGGFSPAQMLGKEKIRAAWGEKV
jgi:gluconate 2-dehydrogenase gamma chain